VEKINSFKDLIVWQKAMNLALEIYKLTEKLPREEMYGLTSQMRRCAISIPSNIAEGRRRASRKELERFFVIAYGSGAELETQIELLKQLPFGNKLSYNSVDSLLSEVMRMINKMLSSLRSSFLTS
jgi:four helix bundle protein